MVQPLNKISGRTGCDSELEEGELEDDFDAKTAYKTIERPVLKKPEAAPVIKYESEEEVSGEDSDDDLASFKRKKTRHEATSPGEMDCGNDGFRQAARNFQAKKGKVNPIWNSFPMDDEIAAGVTSMNVLEGISRESENYSRPPLQEDGSNRKRKRTWNPNIRLIHSIDNPEEYNDEELADEIAARLSEKNKEAIARVVKLAGRETALRYLNDTIDQEAVGGLRTQDNRRQRTPGGTYFYLIRLDDRLPKKIKNQIIFYKDPKTKKEAAKRRRRVKNQKRQEEQKMNTSENLPELPTIAEVVIRQQEAADPESTMNEDNDCNGTVKTDVHFFDSSTLGTGGTENESAVNGSSNHENGEETAMNEENGHDNSTHSPDGTVKETTMNEDDGPFIDATFEDDL